MATPRRSEVAELLAAASRGALRLADIGTGWPATGTLHLGGAQFPVSLYVGVIGETHRGRDDERRFQNPAPNRPITPPDHGMCLLLGAWTPDISPQDPVVVAMDAYRRAGNLTRYSMFVPIALLRQAASEGRAQHENEAGELLHAFRASRLRDYLLQLIRPAVAGEQGTDLFHIPTDTSSVAHTGITDSVHIRPRVGMYAAFARLNYKPWFAIAELVDNAIQSYLTHRNRLSKEPLQIDIRFEEDQIIVEDRAAGIGLADFPRAFSPSHRPPDDTGLSEFGLGLKAAACWFANSWSVRTSALGDPVERTVRFDVNQIVEHSIEHLPIEARPQDPSSHYTIVTLRDLRQRPQKRTIGKIKDHLASIYRILVEKNLVRIRVVLTSSTEELSFRRPQLLLAPHYRRPNEAPRLWRADFNIVLSAAHRVWGWAGILERASGSHAGFSVFRRDRLIQGSVDETYRPLRIFRNPNSYTYQRVVGELFVEGFDVSHTKDGIQWGEREDDLLSKLRLALQDEELPILDQAEGYRARQRAPELPSGFGTEALEGAAAELQASTVDELVAPFTPSERQVLLAPTEKVPPPPTSATIHRAYETVILDDHERLTLRLELLRDPARDWYGYEVTGDATARSLAVWLNLSHPFSESYVNGDENTLAPLVRLVAALATAEHRALQSGIRYAGAIRLRVNQLLRERFGEESQKGQQ